MYKDQLKILLELKNSERPQILEEEKFVEIFYLYYRQGREEVNYKKGKVVGS